LETFSFCSRLNSLLVSLNPKLELLLKLLTPCPRLMLRWMSRKLSNLRNITKVNVTPTLKEVPKAMIVKTKKKELVKEAREFSVLNSDLINNVLIIR